MPGTFTRTLLIWHVTCITQMLLQVPAPPPTPLAHLSPSQLFGGDYQFYRNAKEPSITGVQ